MILIGNAQTVGTRANQEDYFASVEIGDGILSIVSDGMGGYEGGEVASKITVKSFVEFFKKGFDTQDIGDLLTASTHYANSKIVEAKEQDESLEEMGSTIVAVYITAQRLYWVSVGDSLLYRYASHRLQRLNADHSIAGDLQKQVDAGEMSQEVADSKPNRHALTSAMTGYDIPLLEQSHIEIVQGDRFVIASDGIHTLTEKQIAHSLSKIVQNQPLAEALVAQIEKKGLKNQDNTTIVILQPRSEENSAVTNSPTPPQVKSPKTLLLVAIIVVLLGVIIFLLTSNGTLPEDNNQSNVLESNTTLPLLDTTPLEPVENNTTASITAENNQTDEANRTSISEDANTSTLITKDKNASRVQ